MDRLFAFGKQIGRLGAERAGEHVEYAAKRIVGLALDRFTPRLVDRLAQGSTATLEDLVDEFDSEDRHAIGHRHAGSGENGDRAAGLAQKFFGQTVVVGVDCSCVAGQKDGDGQTMFAFEIGHIACIEDRVNGSGHTNEVEPSSRAMSDVNPKQTAFVESFGAGVAEGERVRGVGAAPVGVGHGDVIGGGNSADEDGSRGEFHSAIDERTKPADAGDKICAATPHSKVLAVFVGDDLVDYPRQLGGRVGGEASDGGVGNLVVVEIGVPIVTSDVRRAAPMDVDAGRVKMRGNDAANVGRSSILERCILETLGPKLIFQNFLHPRNLGN